ncbi:MAG: AI-2E family transporter [Alphaproteobacteria bacterium]|nr:AI-2E family transporter [Alphaproteobacteria bacterium]MCB9792097.1 AI-2E family transporter [Alphaproteobacteria bacterium]
MALSIAPDPEPNSSGPSGQLLRGLVISAALVVIFAALRAAESILLPLLFSIMLAILTAPAVSVLERRRVPKALAIASVVSGVIVVLVALVLSVGRSVQDFTQQLPAYQSQLSGLLWNGERWLVERGVPREILNELDIEGTFNPGQVMQLVVSTLGSVVGLLSNLLLVALLLTFILLEFTDFPRKINAIFQDEGQGLGQLAEAARAVQKYLALKTIISLCTGTILGLFTWAMGLPFAFLWGLLAFLLNYIPNIGSILAALPPTVLAAVVLGPLQAAGVLVGFTVVNISIGSLMEPRLMGHNLGMSPLVVFLSLIFWGWLWGPAGMLLSVPLTVMVKIVLEHREDTRWLGILLGPAKAAELSEESS